MLYKTSAISSFISETPNKDDRNLNLYAVRLIRANNGLNVSFE
jgi:hypothetical protein